MDEVPSGSPPPTGPCAMVIFGGTGDLTARKLFPALYNLIKSKLLSADFAILGVVVGVYRPFWEQLEQSAPTNGPTNGPGLAPINPHTNGPTNGPLGG